MELLNNTSPFWAIAIPALGGLIVGIIGAYSARDTRRADAASTLTDAALRLLEEQEQRTAALEKMTTSQAKIVSDLRNRIRSLEENEKQNQLHMLEMEQEQSRLKSVLEQKDNFISELLSGIEILINQIKLHNSSPHWTPYNGAKDE